MPQVSHDALFDNSRVKPPATPTAGHHPAAGAPTLRPEQPRATRRHVTAARPSRAHRPAPTAQHSAQAPQRRRSPPGAQSARYPEQAAPPATGPAARPMPPEPKRRPPPQRQRQPPRHRAQPAKRAAKAGTRCPPRRKRRPPARAPGRARGTGSGHWRSRRVPAPGRARLGPPEQADLPGGLQLGAPRAGRPTAFPGRWGAGPRQAAPR